MKSIKGIFGHKNIGVGYLYFYVHFITELVCFFVFYRHTGNSAFLWMYPLVYDALAFVPQSIIGYIGDKHPKINMGLVGAVLLAVALLTFSLGLLPGKYTSLIVLCFGNAFSHIGGAQATLCASDGKLSHSAIFVAGGSFGLITGRLLATTAMPWYVVLLLVLTTIPFVLLAETYRSDALRERELPCEGFNYASKKMSAGAVLLISVAIIVVRGYMGYGIPTSWNKTVTQTVLLYVTMGIGKAAGGIIADAVGVKKTALISIAGAMPFLLFGDNNMLISLIGVMLFSMTMSITLAVIVSELKRTPGLAFGLTTIGLFLGTVPIFFFKLTTTLANCIVIAVLTVLCILAAILTVRKDEKRCE